MKGNYLQLPAVGGLAVQADAFGHAQGRLLVRVLENFRVNRKVGLKMTKVGF